MRGEGKGLLEGRMHRGVKRCGLSSLSSLKIAGGGPRLDRIGHWHGLIWSPSGTRAGRRTTWT